MEKQQKSAAQMLLAVSEVHMLKELKQRAGVSNLADVPYATIQAFYVSLIRKAAHVVKNAITGRIVCNLDGEYKLFRSKYEAQKYIAGYGVGGLNPAIYQAVPVYVDKTAVDNVMKGKV